jgi:type IV pilus assembly protein PilM
MSFFRHIPGLSYITRLVTDPPPSYVFELSEAGIAFAHNGTPGFEPLPEGALSVSPITDNLVRADVAAQVLQKIAPVNGARKRRPAALILPDYAARVTVLDFDSFPGSPEEQASLVRFRVKKTVPFDIDSAAVSFWAHPAAASGGSKKNGSKKIEVTAVMVTLEILARYEALFRNANFHPGEVTTSSLAALNLCNEEGVAVLAKLSSNVLTLVVMDSGRLKLFRCLALEDSSEEEILSVLHPTFAYVEDELGQQVRKLIVCGFSTLPASLRMEVEPLRSRCGAPEAFNAGLLGYLEGASA